MILKMSKTNPNLNHNVKKVKAFTKKILTVQDYPDPKYDIVIYGTSKYSDFKLNDVVYIIDGGARGVGGYPQSVIGFDQNGAPHLQGCAWNNTRGGYDDDNLISNADYQKVYQDFDYTQVKELVAYKKWITEHKAAGKFSWGTVDEHLQSEIMKYICYNWTKNYASK